MSTLNQKGFALTETPMDYWIGVRRYTKRDIENYLQKELKKLSEGLRIKGWDIPDIDVKVNIDCIGKFYLFVLSFPETILEERQKKYQDVPSVLRPNSGGAPRLLEPVYQFITKLMFPKSYRDSFRSPSTKKKYHFTEKEMSIISRYLTPTVRHQNNDGESYSQVVIAIDPVKLFWTMMAPKTDDKGNPVDSGSKFRYKANVKAVEELSPGNFRFTVYRVPDFGDQNKKSARGFSVSEDIANQNSGKNFRNSDDRSRRRRRHKD